MLMLYVAKEQPLGLVARNNGIMQFFVGWLGALELRGQAQLTAPALNTEGDV
jgi:hypothetical protein